jgi:hypothetical protein
VAELWQKNNGGVRRKLWNWECPQKIKLFSSLLIEDKLLTWNNLLKRGWQGPRLCLLCRGNEETGLHLFVQCPFTVSIWNKITIHFKLVFGWMGSIVLECFDYWLRRNSACSSLPTLICWYIWNDRNLAIFMFSIIVWVNLHSIIGHGTVAEGPGVHRSLHAHRSPIFLPLYSKENILHIDLELRPLSTHLTTNLRKPRNRQQAKSTKQ